MGIGTFLKQAVTWWNGATLGTLLHTRIAGIRVGEDDEGNVYYRDRADRRRWVIYSGEVEASRINPDWHAWLHHTVKEPPTERPLPHKPWEREHHPNLTGTPWTYLPPGSILRPDPVERRDYEPWTPDADDAAEAAPAQPAHV